MKRVLDSAHLKHLRRGWPIAVILLSLAVLFSIIALAHHALRSILREQIAGRDASLIHALALGQRYRDATELGSNSDDSFNDQFLAIVELYDRPQLAGLIAIRFFDEHGKFLPPPFPYNVTESQLDPPDLIQLRQLHTTNHFRPHTQASELYLQDPSSPRPAAVLPIQEVLLPLHSSEGKFQGAAQLILDGSSLAQQFAQIDRQLNFQALIAFLISGTLLTTAMALGFHQLNRANRLLSQRTQSLLQANQELTLAAKTSALGTVTAHLIHGLKNPLFGLNRFIANRDGSENGSDTEWQIAAASARRMQGLVNDVVRVLREEQCSTRFELSLDEMAGILAHKFQNTAREKQVRFESEVSAEGMLNNRDANLVMLILENLLHNAVQATPTSRAVRLAIRSADEGVVCEVIDQGPGLPQLVRENLFTPCQSTKQGGSGIGLAISKQLSGHLGASLELKSSSAAGCVFALLLPASLFQPSAERPAVAPSPSAV